MTRETSGKPRTGVVLAMQPKSFVQDQATNFNNFGGVDNLAFFSDSPAL